MTVQGVLLLLYEMVLRAHSPVVPETKVSSLSENAHDAICHIDDNVREYV